MKKTVELTEPVYAHLRICDANVYNTIGVLYDFWLNAQGYVASWERTKFSKVGWRGGFPAKGMFFGG